MNKPLFSAQQLLEFENALKNKWGLLPNIIKELEFSARVMYEKYEILTKEGFTKDEAMQIIVGRGTDTEL